MAARERVFPLDLDRRAFGLDLSVSLGYWYTVRSRALAVCWRMEYVDQVVVNEARGYITR
jgi:hypothetical protein